MNRLSRLSMLMGMILLLGIASIVASVPPLLNYQGRLLDSAGIPLNGIYSLTFRIYDADVNGQILWIEVQDLTVADGLFSTLLGSVTPLPTGLFSSDQRWLGITVGADPELQPRRRIVTAAFANNSLYSDSAAIAASVGANSVNSSSIQDFTIDGDDIKGGTITGDKIASNAIVSSKITDGSIVGVDIAGSQITSSHVVNGTLIGADIADGSINGSKIADASLAAVDMVPNSITSNEIQDASIAGIDLADASITSLKIADGTVNSADIGTNAVGASEIAADAVNAAKISDEPGVAQNLYSVDAGIELTDTFTVNIRSRAINCPADGYVFAMVSCNLSYVQGQSNELQTKLALSNVSSTLPADVSSLMYIADPAITMPYSSQRIYGVTAGSQTFYFVGHLANPGSPNCKVWDIMMSLIFIPSSYGIVSGATPETPPASEPDAADAPNR